jgi:hypothetical protein
MIALGKKQLNDPNALRERRACVESLLGEDRSIAGRRPIISKSFQPGMGKRGVLCWSQAAPAKRDCRD